jgi:hypothetical protein
MKYYPQGYLWKPLVIIAILWPILDIIGIKLGLVDSKHLVSTFKFIFNAAFFCLSVKLLWWLWEE